MVCKTAAFKPGERYEYSDSNFMLAALVLEAVLGHDYNQEIAARFLYPLQLNATSSSESRTEAGMTQGYIQVGDNPLGRMYGKPGQVVPFMQPAGVQRVNPRVEGAGGGYTTNAPDLARWAKALYENRAFKGDYVQMALASFGPQNEETRRTGPYGMGMFVWDPAAGYKMASPVSGKQYGHLGVYGGYTSAVMYFPDHRISVAIMFNGESPREVRHSAATDIADRVVRYLDGSDK